MSTHFILSPPRYFESRLRVPSKPGDPPAAILETGVSQPNIASRHKTNVFRLRSGEVVIEIDEHYLDHAAQSERVSALLPTKPHPTSASRLHSFDAARSSGPGRHL